MTFNISCTGAGGTVNDSVSVNLADQPSICTDTNANNYGQPLPCTYSGATACTVSASPSSTANFPLNNVDVTVTVLNWDTTAHEYDVDCTNNGSYEETTYLTWTPHTFNNICSYSAPATLRGHVRNLATQATADCTTPITNSNRTLTASISSGSGTISGTGISCPTDCSEVYADGTNVTLTAAPAANYTFAGWSGACSGLSSCSVLMNQNRSVAASFTYSPFDYSLSNSGNSSVTKTSGNAYTQNVITKALVTGTTQAVTLSLSGVPGGTSYSISNGACSPNCNSTITFTVPPSTPAGTYPITVTGSPLNRTTSFNLIVSGAPISVSCLASPQTALLGQNVTWTVTVSGGTAPFTYAWSGTGIPTSPAPSSNPYTRTYSTIGLKSAQATVTDSDSIQSTCPAGTVMINFNPEFEEF
ncbi:MAG: hypothetical protein A3J09_02260 [Candidatus Zambryskibacteria bacterium RIFCSPLOWO2_02_FULL_51_21]|nr:MAG: hypothetical protein A2723_02260 [Candidatus Zambryskibacteria bacterium RIFCSPHIGHO2_01_FULL_52_18]OHB11357.1 MAG: hypothetical protein A3J09_02260 [Candidatus Zambryskibacteria bacterium RIFCSPLOWO2_02_FULL_51_21]